MLALISGASRGIGRAMAIEFAKKGYDVLINFNEHIDEAAITLDEVNKYSKGFIYGADVSNYEDVCQMKEEIFKRYKRVDVLVNNAGVALTKLVQDTSEEEYDKVFDTNMKGCFNMTKAFIKHMIHEGGGSIINVTSMWGETGAAMETVYSASKGAVIAFTKAVAKEAAPSGVRVNAISLGCIATDMMKAYSEAELDMLRDETPLEAIGTAEDAAKAAVFLASQDAKFITGEVLRVNGGFYI